MNSPFLIILAIVIIVERIVAKAFDPLRAIPMPTWAKTVLDTLSPYLVWVLAAVAVWYTEINVFVQFIPSPLAGRVMTAILAGGGSSLLKDIKDDLSMLVLSIDPRDVEHLCKYGDL